MTQPKQPVILVAGQPRFQPNKVVRHLLDTSPTDLNKLWVLFSSGVFTVEDMRQFYQLIGYSVDGFAEVFEEEGS